MNCNPNAIVFEQVRTTALKMVNSFINFDDIQTSQTLPVLLQQVMIEDRARELKPVVLTCGVCLLPGLGRKVASAPTLRGLLLTFG